MRTKRSVLALTPAAFCLAQDAPNVLHPITIAITNNPLFLRLKHNATTAIERIDKPNKPVALVAPAAKSQLTALFEVPLMALL